MAATREPPIIISPSSPPSDITHSSAFIFLHGLGDTASGVENIAHQFQSANKLPHMTWVIPNAPELHDLASTAWFLPTRLSPYPPSRPELEDEEDEDGILASVAYVKSLIDDLVQQGIPKNRIVVGGFSQGHAIALSTFLLSPVASGIAGIVGLSGYLPLASRIDSLREDANLPAKVHPSNGGGKATKIFLARGTNDRLVPRRYHRLCYEALYELGVEEGDVTIREYEGLGHVMGGAELRDLCTWLEDVVPDLSVTPAGAET
ncbi:hypothetical protein NX059_003156 [Plenodomus lindquistii]|nr:hypothetical protein NX059_003156 [Plenodomus lindquistii]